MQGRAANPEKYREREARYRAENLEVCRERYRRYDAANREKRREAAYQYREQCREREAQYRKANRARLRAACRQWYAANGEGAREYARQRYWTNPEKYREAAQQWGRDNPHKVAALGAKRRAREAQANPPWLTAADHEATCDMAKVSVDHVLPLEPCRGCGAWGCHEPGNLQLLTNSSKHNRCMACWLKANPPMAREFTRRVLV